MKTRNVPIDVQELELFSILCVHVGTRSQSHFGFMKNHPTFSLPNFAQDAHYVQLKTLNHVCVGMSEAAMRFAFETIPGKHSAIV